MSIVLEGVAGSGKTSLAIALAREGWIIIPELSELIPPKNFPPFTTNLQKARATNRWFLDREVERQCHAGKVIFDRDFHSVLSVSYAREKLFGVSDGARALVQEYLDRGLLQQHPLAIIDTPIDCCLQRTRQRYEDETIMHSLNIYREFLDTQKEYYLSQKGLFINGKESLATQVQEIISFIKL